MQEDTSIAMLLRRTYLTMHREADAVLKPHGLTANQFVVILALHTEGEMTQVSLAKRSVTDKNTLRPMLLSLEKKRLLSRRRHPTDRRVRIVKLTKAGKKTCEQLQEVGMSFQQRLSSSFNKKELTTLLDMLNRITAVMQPHDNTPRLS